MLRTKEVRQAEQRGQQRGQQRRRQPDAYHPGEVRYRVGGEQFI